MSQKLCAEAGCGAPHLAKGKCRKHYMREMRGYGRRARTAPTPRPPKPARPGLEDGMETVSQVAARLEMSVEQVRWLCRRGRFAGAIQVGAGLRRQDWRIPLGAVPVKFTRWGMRK